MAFMKKSPTSARTAQPRRGWFVASRATFWIFWSLSTLAGTAFAVLALLSFVQMHRVHNTPDFTGGRQIRGPMAAEIFGAVAVVFTNALAFIILLWKTARRNGTGFGYGYVVASYGITGLWLVLSGIVMWAGNEKSLWSTTSHWSHGISVAYTAAYLLAWITAGIYLLTWAVLFSFRRSFSHPPAVAGDAETGMASAYPAATTYSSPAFANSPRAAPTTAPRAASKGRFWRKQPAGTAPLTAGAAAAAATSSSTNEISDSRLNSTSVPAHQPTATGPLETAVGQAAPKGNTGAFTQYHGQTTANDYSREAELGPVGPRGVNGGDGRMAHMHGQRQDNNRAGFFQASQA